MIREDSLLTHRLKNLFHTIFLFLSMVFILSLLGFFLAGTDGIIWAVMIAVFIFMISSNISPALILKMYRARPLSVHEAPGIHKIIRELTSRAGLPVTPRLYYIPSEIMNAFSVGTRDNPAIGITQGLLQALSTRELVGVLAHEISHIQHNDMKVMSYADIISRVTSILSTAGQMFLILNFPFLLLNMETISWFGILLLIAAPTLSGLLQLALSRTREFDADLEAARLTGDPEGLALALKKLDRYKASFWDRLIFHGRRIPEPSIFRTHPDTAERVERLLSLREPESARLNYSTFDRFTSPDHLTSLIRKPRWYISGLWY